MSEPNAKSNSFKTTLTRTEVESLLLILEVDLDALGASRPVQAQLLRAKRKFTKMLEEANALHETQP